MNVLLGLGLLLMTACMNCQALSDMQQLQHKTKLVSSLQCPSCNNHILCRERCICNLLVLSCRLNWLDLLFDTEMKFLNVKNKLYLSYFSGSQRKIPLISMSVKTSKEMFGYCLLLTSILLAFTWWVLPPNWYYCSFKTEFKRSLIACKPTAFFVKWKSYLCEALLLTSLPQVSEHLMY